MAGSNQNQNRGIVVVLLVLLVIAVVALFSRCSPGDTQEQTVPAAPTTTAAPTETPTEEATVEEVTPEIEEPVADVVYEVLKDGVDGSDAFYNGQTIGYDQGFRYVCWSYEPQQAIEEMTERFVPEAETTTDERVLDFVAGLQDGAVHAFRDAIDGNIGGDIVGDCEPLENLSITNAVTEQFEAHVPGNVEVESEGYERDNRYEGGDHVDNDGDLHEEGIDEAHDGRSDAYYAGESIAYSDNGNAWLFPCWGYELDEALAEGIETELPKDASDDMIAGYTDGFRSSFADGINERNAGNCEAIGAN